MRSESTIIDQCIKPTQLLFVINNYYCSQIVKYEALENGHSNFEKKRSNYLLKLPVHKYISHKLYNNNNMTIHIFI